VSDGAILDLKIIGRNIDIGRYGVDQIGVIEDVSGIEMARRVGSVDVSVDRAIENGRSLLQLDGQRCRTGAKGREKIAEIGGLQMDGEPASEDAGEIGARVGKRNGGTAQIEKAGARVIGSGDLAIHRGTLAGERGSGGGRAGESAGAT
jgi:hypothetical protein